MVTYSNLEELLPILDYTGRLCPKGYILIFRLEVCKREGVSVKLKYGKCRENCNFVFKRAFKIPWTNPMVDSVGIFERVRVNNSVGRYVQKCMQQCFTTKGGHLTGWAQEGGGGGGGGVSWKQQIWQKQSIQWKWKIWGNFAKGQHLTEWAQERGTMKAANLTKTMNLMKMANLTKFCQRSEHLTEWPQEKGALKVANSKKLKGKFSQIHHVPFLHAFLDVCISAWYYGFQQHSLLQAMHAYAYYS